MARYNFQVYGDADSFLCKLPSRKKSLVVNAIILQCLKSSKIKEILSIYFTEEEIGVILDKEIKEKKPLKKREEKREEKREKKPKVDDKSSENFKIEI